MTNDTILNQTKTDLILFGFQYDKVTNQTITWLDLSLPNSKMNIHKLNDVHTFQETLANLISNKNYKLEMFCGHGIGIGLLGPEQNNDLKQHITINNLRHSIFYTTEMVSTLPGSLFAFCCNSAKTFGKSYGTFIGKVFLGFKDELPFPEEIYSLVKEAFQRTALEIIKSGQIESKHEVFLKSVIDEIIEKAHNGEVVCENPFLIELYLNQFKVHLVMI
jgi:hypothetical protein